jgi:hypothetical protein
VSLPWASLHLTDQHLPAAHSTRSSSALSPPHPVVPRVNPHHVVPPRPCDPVAQQSHQPGLSPNNPINQAAVTITLAKLGLAARDRDVADYTSLLKDIWEIWKNVDAMDD